MLQTFLPGSSLSEAGDRGQRAVAPPTFSKLLDFFEVLMLFRQIFGFSLLLKTKVSNFIRKSLNLSPPPTEQVLRRPCFLHHLLSNLKTEKSNKTEKFHCR